MAASVNFRRFGRIAFRTTAYIGIGYSLFHSTKIHLFPQLMVPRELTPNYLKTPEKCQKIFREQARKMNFQNIDKVALQVNGTKQGFSCGSTFLPNGALIALPMWVLLVEDEDALLKKANEFGTADPLFIKAHDEFKKTFLPYEDKIAFIVGHEIGHLQNPANTILKAFMPPAWLYSIYKLISFKSRYSKFITIPLKFAVLVGSYYCFEFAATRAHWQGEFMADKASAIVDKETAKAGVDYLNAWVSYRKYLSKWPNLKEGRAVGKPYEDVATLTHPTMQARIERLQAIVDGHFN